MKSLLKETIEFYIEETRKNSKNALMIVLEQIIAIKDNPLNILNIDINNEFISEIFDDNENIDDIVNNLKFIKKIYVANNEGIKFELTSEQKDLLEQFIKNSKKKLNLMNKEIDSKLDVYINLCKKIKEEKEVITEIDEINHVLEKNYINYDTRNQIILEMLTYNKNVISKNVGEVSTVKKGVEEKSLSIETLTGLFNKYLYNINQISDECIKYLLEKRSLENIESILKLIVEKEFKFISKNQKLFEMIISYSNVDVLNKLKDISIKYGFKLQEIQDVTSIFIPKGAKGKKVLSGYENFIEVIEILDKHNFDIPLVAENSDNLFRISKNTIEKNITAFNLYGLKIRENKKNSGFSIYSWLGAANLMDTCDQFIELDLFDYIKTFTSKLNLPKDSLCFYRIYRAQKEGTSIYSKIRYGDGSYTLNGEIFGRTPALGITSMSDVKRCCKNVIVDANEEIDFILNNNDNDKIETDLVFANDLLGQLEKYKKNMHIYNFNGKYISRIKVLRLASTLLKNGIELNSDNLLYLITKNSIISNKDLDFIRNSVNSLDYGRRKK